MGVELQRLKAGDGQEPIKKTRAFLELLELSPRDETRLLQGVSLYYGVLVFNLGVTFWIGESFMGMSGLLMHLPVIALLMFRLAGPRGKRKERDLRDV